MNAPQRGCSGRGVLAPGEAQAERCALKEQDTQERRRREEAAGALLQQPFHPSSVSCFMSMVLVPASRRLPPDDKDMDARSVQDHLAPPGSTCPFRIILPLQGVLDACVCAPA